MNIEELKSTPEWQAASKQKRHSFLTVIQREQKAAKQVAQAIAARKPTEPKQPKKKTPAPVGQKSVKKMESHQINALARDICRCAGYKQADVAGLGLFGVIAGKVQEVIGETYSGSAKVFVKKHQAQLREWCRANWIPKAGGAKKPNRSQRPVEKSTPFKRQAPEPKQACTLTHTTPMSGVNVQTDAFLSTFEWRRVRMMALKKYTPVCMCCGASPQTGAVMNVDHIKPRKLFPELALDVDNLQILCHDCNHGKGNWDATDWRPPLH